MSQGTKHGPVLSPTEWIPAEAGKSYDSDTSCVYNGVAGYPKGTPGKIDEVTFDTGGKFGKVPPVKE